MSDWKNNRPLDWDAIEIAKTVEGRSFKGVSQLDVDLIEAGADAMLKALKNKGVVMSPEQMKLIVPDRKYPFGWLVFIPDEKTEVVDITPHKSEDSLVSIPDEEGNDAKS